jgi:hypothetical protein
MRVLVIVLELLNGEAGFPGDEQKDCMVEINRAVVWCSMGY